MNLKTSHSDGAGACQTHTQSYSWRKTDIEVPGTEQGGDLIVVVLCSFSGIAKGEDPDYSPAAWHSGRNSMASELIVQQVHTLIFSFP